MAELKTVADFENYLVGLENQMIGIAQEVEKIKSGLGKAIVKKIQEGALSLVGINLNVPDWSVWLNMGAIGIIFSERERIKLKPYLKELELLRAEKGRIVQELVFLVPREASEKAAKDEQLSKIGLKVDTVTGEITTIQRQLNLDRFTESTGIPKLLRKYNIDPRLAYLAYPLGIYVGAKVLSKFKRKRK
jgi:hypothetical protein